jgi:hypothetical protein
MNLSESVQAPVIASPFDLANGEAYRAWRARKLAAAAQSARALVVSIEDGQRLSALEMDAVHAALARANLAIYRLPEAQRADKLVLRQLGRQFGLERLDGNLCADDDSITSLTVVEKPRQGEYIPYTSRRLNWHWCVP